MFKKFWENIENASIVDDIITEISSDRIIAVFQNEQVGYIDFENIENVIVVRYIFVEPWYRRVGVAAKMLHDLVVSFPEHKIAISSTSDSGSKFLKAYFKLHPEDENRFTSDILMEMPFLNNKNTILGKNNHGFFDRLAHRYQDTKQKFKKVDKFKVADYEYEVWYNKNIEGWRIFVFFEKNHVGFMGASRMDTITDKIPYQYPQIKSVFVLENHQNKGIGYNLYKILLNHTGGIISDEEMTDGAIKIWKKIAPEYHLYKISPGYNIYNKEKEELTPIQDITDNELKDYGILLVMSNKELI